MSSRAEMLQRRRNTDNDWTFIPEHQIGAMEEYLPKDNIVADPERGGYWIRKQGKATPPQRQAERQRYEPQRSQFADMMDGISHLCQGFKLISQASDEDFNPLGIAQPPDGFSWRRR